MVAAIKPLDDGNRLIDLVGVMKKGEIVRPDVAARNATYDRNAVTIATSNEEARKKCGVIARTLMARAAKAAKHTPETAPMRIVAQPLALTGGILRLAAPKLLTVPSDSSV